MAPFFQHPLFRMLPWLFFCFIHCGPISFLNPQTSISSHYAGPSSHIDVKLINNGFSITKKDTFNTSIIDLSIGGTRQVFQNGFSKCIITSTSNPNMVALSTILYGLEIPSITFLLMPFNPLQSNQMLSFLNAGTCPLENSTSNWILTRLDQTTNINNQALFGTFTYNVSTFASTLNTAYNLNASLTNQQSFSPQACSQGLIATQGNTLIYTTAFGGMLLNTNTFNRNAASFYFGLPQSILKTSALSGTYSGFLYQSARPSGFQVQPIKAIFSSSNQGISVSYALLTNVDTDTTGNEGGTLLFPTLNTPSMGFMQGSLSPYGSVFTTQSNSAIACMGATDINNTASTLISCIAIDPGNASGILNLWFVSRNTS